MRNTLPLLSRPISPSTATATPPQPPVPTIRLISATPSATGMSSDGNSSTSRANISVDASWASVGPVPSPLSPRVTDVPSRKRLVPKKSKLGLLGVGKEKEKEKERTRDFSDLVRRVGGDGSASASLKGGFEIYVDPTEDPDFGEIVVVKKKKSRAGLDGMRWGSGSGGALGEVTNVPSVSREVREKEAKDSMLLKVKAEEKDKDKWWSIGRGRKDSKEKTKEKEDAKSRVREKSKTRAKSPGPLIISNPIPIEEPQSRARFNSFDSRILLNPHAAPPPTAYGTVSNAQMLRALESQPRSESPITYTRSGTPTAGGLLAPPTNRPDGNQGSIAIRAMRSVRSLARIGSWAQLRNGEEGMPPAKPEPKEKPKVEKPEDSVREKSGVKKKGAEKEKAPEDGKKKKKKKETKEKEKEKAQTVRMSTSSFEVGALTASPEARRTESQTQTLGKKKLSILGMGLPSSMRMRSGSTASSMVLGTSHPPVSGANNRLSVESTTILGRGRAGSTISTASSLRPISTASSGSRASSASGGSTASVKWDEECLETVKETRRKERAARREEARADLEGKNGVKESRRTSEGRRRTPLSEVFPDAQQMQTNSNSPIRPTEYPLLTVEEATSDGHGDPDASLATPLKKARPRPMSEQLLGKSRPKGMYEEDGEGVISILDAATNDLALLINRLDLEATPGTPDISPFRPSPLSNDRLPGSSAAQSANITKKKTLPPSESPVKKGLRASTTSISSLRPYAESRKSVSSATATAIENVIGQQIASWSKLNSGLSPVKDVSPRPPPKTTSTTLTPPKFRLKHKPSMTPSPAADPSPVFQPLRPAKSRAAIATLRYSGSPASSGSPDDYGTVRAPSSLTFGGSRSSSRSGSAGSLDDMNGSPVFKKARGHTRKRSSLVPVDLQNTYSNLHRDNESTSMPIPPEAKRVLGLSGTMGSSSGYNDQEVDVDDPDSDIPDELQVILSGNSDEGSIRSVDDTLSFRPDSPLPSPGLPPMLPLPVSPPPAPVLELPVFRAQLIDEEANHADIDEGNSSSEDDTKKSFDFTGELKKLNESGASDRRSFVEQLENAFRTPAKIDLHHGFDGLLSDGLLHVDIPPVPKLPTSLRTYIGDGSQSSSDVEPVSSFSDTQDPIILHFDHSENGSGSSSGVESYSASQIIHAKEPTLLPGSDSLASIENYRDQVLMEIDSPRASRSMSSMGSRPSDGKLNKNFKFGGKPPAQSPASDSDISKPLTLSDIIPPPSHCRSLSMSSMMEEDDSVLDSIFAKASDIPAPRVRLDSDSSSKRQARNFARISANLHARAHSRQSSGLSFAGFESFEEVRRGFEFGNGRPAFYPPVGAAPRVSHAKHESLFSIASVSSYGRVIDSGSIDPFDYGLPSLQERPSSENLSMSMSMSVDDTFSFLDRAPRRRRVDSDASSFYFHAPLPTTIRPYSRGHRRHESNMSVVSQAPPISLYNRSMGTHRRNDSNSSGSSVAHSYAMFGANGGRAAWARHRQDASVDSVMSDFSAMRLGRPGIGDKMFDTSENQGFPLSSISASPPESSREERSPNRPSFDSILDEERRSSVEDSLFDQTGRLSSTSSDSVFGYDYSRAPQSHLLPPNHFRPLSSLSDNSIHSPMKEDDTMISMLGGGHVRRRSVGSMIEASPCVRIEKRKHTTFRGANKYEEPYQDSPNKARIIEKPSIASTSSYKFGGERMIKAQRGLLQRQSLEDSCLIADGEDLLSTSIRPVPVFSRPGPPARSRSSTCTSSSSGGETPPLSSSDGSSISGGSQSSIDLSHLNMILSNATHPVTATHNSRAMARARARGHGHRRRFSHARASRSSVYETIQEEMSVSSGSSDSSSPSPARTGSSSSRKNTPTVRQAVFIVEPEEPPYGSPSANSIWDDERGIVALRKYYALRDEANTAVDESHRKWADTAFSIFALQSFQPPRQPAAMQALLEQSVQTYGPLPSELRPRRMRSRTQSRPSPYPDPRRIKVKQDLQQQQQVPSEASPIPTPTHPLAPSVLQPVVPKHNHNIMSPAPSLDAPKPFSPLVVEVEPKRESVSVFGAARPRVGSNARRTNLGWSKRSTGAKSSTEGKENIGYGSLATPGESLRINRPRPRGRPTPARPAPGSTTQKPIRV